MENVIATNALFREKKRRVWELDFLRGLAVILTCFDHLMCDFVYLDGWFSNFNEVHNGFIDAMVEFARNYWNSDLRFWGHYIFVSLFLFLVGTSCALSRDNVRRGAGLGVFAMAFTGVSFVLKDIGVLEDGIVFGILDCIALSILCAAAVDTATKGNKWVNLFLPLALGTVILSVGISRQFWTISYDWNFDPSHMLGYIIGTNAFGDDWFGLFPYVGMVLIGMYWGKAVYKTRTSLLPILDGKWNKPVKFVGRHALIFYIVHQAVLSGIVMLVCMALGYKSAF